MLTSTYIHVQGIGYTTERRIWELGALTWEHYIDKHDKLPIPDIKKNLILPRIEESISRLSGQDHKFFAQALPSKEHWRAIGDFKDKIAYLDIETTGCGQNDSITVIGLYDGKEMQTFVQDMNIEEFPKVVSQYKMLVTFFGSGFDIPVIRRAFPDIELDHLHVDLCFLLRRIGLSGGLKSIEDRLGIRRMPETCGLHGLDAVRLWDEYQKGSDEALELLLLYNKEDVMNMEALLCYGCNELVKKLNLPLIGKIQQNFNRRDRLAHTF